MSSARSQPRLTREDWLEQALDVLAEDPEHLHVEALAKRLGVSKGSFYWHFDNRAQFVLELARYWRDVYTAQVVSEIEARSGTPEERLRALMMIILTEKRGSRDVPIRALARIEPSIQPIVRENDELRMAALRSLFREMGFAGRELEARTRMFVVLFSFDEALSIPMALEDVDWHLDARLRLLTAK